MGERVRRDPGPTRVLVVDDEAEVAETTATFLRRDRDDVSVETVSTAEAALERLGNGRFDCVVSDYRMPGKNGLELLEAARDRQPDLPFVLFTGRGSEEIASEAISAGVTDYLQKTGGPEQYERLANRVDHATTARRTALDAAGTRAHLDSVVQSAEVAILTVDASSTVQFANGAVADVFGYAPEAVVGQPLTMLMPERHREDHLEGFGRYLETGERRLDWSHVEFTARHRDGHEVPVSVSFGAFVRDGERYFTGIVRDVTRRKRNERRQAGLNELLGEYLLAEDRQAVCDATVEAAAERLDLETAAVARFDDAEGALRIAASTPDAESALDVSALLEQPDGPAWTTFTAGEPAVFHDPALVAESRRPAELHLQPLGRHGVLVVATEVADRRPDTEPDFVGSVAANLQGALDRVAREELLRHRERRLEEQNEWLDQLNRLNDVIRRIDRGLVGATTREEVERTVCAELVDDGPFRFAWFGGSDAHDGGVSHRESAGDEPGLVDAVAGGDAEDDDPTARAARTGEPVVEADVVGEPPLATWRTALLDRDLRSAMAIPVHYRDRRYGVLTIYADGPNAFDELERAVLEEFGATIGYALNAIGARRALVSDEVVELEFAIDPASFPLLGTVGATEGTAFELEGVVPDDDGYRVFFTLEAAPEDVLERLSATDRVGSPTRIAEWAGTGLYECSVTDSGFVAWLVGHGAVPRALSVAEGARVRVELGDDADVRAFVELFQEAYPGTELVARRAHERPVRTRETFLADLVDRLTARQLEVLQAAFHSGYFESPRRRTGQAVAASLGITQPTFSDHLRASLRQLLELVLLGEDRRP